MKKPLIVFCVFLTIFGAPLVNGLGIPGFGGSGEDSSSSTSGSGGSGSTSCSTAADCPKHHKCVFGACSQAANKDGDCPEACDQPEYCDPSSCGGGQVIDCTTDWECDGDLKCCTTFCGDYLCTAPAVDEDDPCSLCAPTEECDPFTNTCKDACSLSRCDPNILCAAGFVRREDLGSFDCYECRCRDPCADVDCGAGARCVFQPQNCNYASCSSNGVCARDSCSIGGPLALFSGVRDCLACLPDIEPACSDGYVCVDDDFDGRGECCAIRPCDLEPDTGPGTNYEDKFYFDKTSGFKGTCKRFSYGGIGGNENRFDTMEACNEACGDDCNPVCSPDEFCPGGRPAPVFGCLDCECRDPCADIECEVDERCVLQEVTCVTEPCFPVGVCEKDACVYGNPITVLGGVKTCSGPESNECGDGNVCSDNDEDGRYECCAESLCNIRPDSGIGNDLQEKWYFDSVSRSCSRFIYRGERGNRNRFDSPEDCEKACLEKCSEDRCPLELFCPGGLKVDSSDPNCVECECNDPCQDVVCDEDEVCIPRPVTCVSPPCNPIGECAKDVCLDGGPFADINGVVECTSNSDCPAGYACTDIDDDGVRNCCAEDSCDLPPDSGVGNDFKTRWYFDRNDEQCRIFQYSGDEDGGNSNRFESFNDCKKACLDGCDVGQCPDELRCSIGQVEKFFDPETSSSCFDCRCFDPCEDVECEVPGDVCVATPILCIRSPCYPLPSCQKDRCAVDSLFSPLFADSENMVDCTSTGTCPQPGYECTDNDGDGEKNCCPKSVCDLPMDSGSGSSSSGYVRRWGFNRDQGRCERFLYTGVGGNGNRFNSFETCTKACVDECSAERCPADLRCPFGLVEKSFDASGSCFECRCFDPCENIVCEVGETCVARPVTCIRSPCYPIGQCIPKVCKFDGPFSPRLNNNGFRIDCTFFGLCFEPGYICTDNDDDGFRTCCPERVCDLPMDSGPGTIFQQKWTFNRNSGNCEKFQYGGIGGNGNRYDSFVECSRACLEDCSEDRCFPGLECPGGLVETSFDAETGLSCFDCQCNDPCNGFECGVGETCVLVPVTCIRSPCPPVPQCTRDVCAYGGPLTQQGGVRDCNNVPANEAKCRTGFNCEDDNDDGVGECCAARRCDLDPDSGPGTDFVRRWYFKRSTEGGTSGQCFEFQYGRVGGNENRFLTKEACTRACSCSPPVCTPPFDPLDCSYGLATDINGCKICSCAPNPCDTFTDCNPENEVCVPVFDLATEEVNPKCFEIPVPGQCPPVPDGLFGICAELCESDADCEEELDIFGNPKKCCSNGCGHVCTPSVPQPPSCAAITCAEGYNCLEDQGCVPTGQCTARKVFVSDIQCPLTCLSPLIFCLPSPIPTPGCICDPRRPNNINDNGNCVTAEECPGRCLHAKPSDSGPCADVRCAPGERCGIGLFNEGGCCPADCRSPAVVGPCEALIPSWFYNINTGSCESFTYGGCDGNFNRFDSEGECQIACGSICEDPLKIGPCDANFPRWYFNQQTQLCEQFGWGGCEPNGNNFESLAQCQVNCEVDNEKCRAASIVPIGTAGCPASCTVGRGCFQAEDGEYICCQLSPAQLCARGIISSEPDNECTRVDCHPQYPICKIDEFGRAICCKPDPSTDNPCEFGDPLEDANGVPLFCGRGPSRVDCPSGSKCVIDATDRFAVCCPTDCALPPETGPCRAFIPSWYYDINTGTCNQFVYGGCQGNNNRFSSKSECQDVCGGNCIGDLVYEPEYPTPALCCAPCCEPCPLCPCSSNTEPRCVCPDGKVHNGNGECIPPDQCPPPFRSCAFARVPDPNDASSPCRGFGPCPDGESCFIDEAGLPRCCPAQKPGSCPMSTIGICVEECGIDAGCPGDEKCCSTGCGNACVPPVDEKEGFCPNDVGDPEGCDNGDECETDSDCCFHLKCCSSGGCKICVEPVDNKPGACPKPTLPVGGVCNNRCFKDRDCSGTDKCCVLQDGCEQCKPPEIFQPPKPGVCPAPHRCGQRSCTHECSLDQHCSDDQKCCSNGCGSVCVDPIGLFDSCDLGRPKLDPWGKQLYCGSSGHSCPLYSECITAGDESSAYCCSRCSCKQRDFPKI